MRDNPAVHPGDWLPADVADFADDASDWWAMHGDAVKAAIRCVRAKHEAINKVKE